MFSLFLLFKFPIIFIKLFFACFINSLLTSSGPDAYGIFRCLTSFINSSLVGVTISLPLLFFSFFPGFNKNFASSLLNLAMLFPLLHCILFFYIVSCCLYHSTIYIFYNFIYSSSFLTAASNRVLMYLYLYSQTFTIPIAILSSRN